MIKNVAPVDRVIRLIIALALIVLVALGIIGGYLSILSWFIAAVFILTVVVGVCPLYSLFGVSTCRTKKPLH